MVSDPRDTPPDFRLPPISPAAPGPLYQQIVDGVKRHVAEGRLPADTPLPSFRALAEQLLVSVITVKRAYEELERDGIIYRKQGVGTFVAADGVRRCREVQQGAAEALLEQALAMARDAGMTPAEIQAWVRARLEAEGKADRR